MAWFKRRRMFRRLFRKRKKFYHRRRNLRMFRNRRRRRNDYRKQTVLSDITYTLDVTHEQDSKSSTNNAEMWGANCSLSALQTPEFKTLCKDWKFCKINSISYACTVGAIGYNVYEPADAKAKVQAQRIDLEVNDIVKNQPFYFIWDADTRLAESGNVNPNQLMSETSKKHCIINGKKSAFFNLRPPSILRRYYDSKVVYNNRNKNTWGEYFDNLSTISNYRMCNTFRGTCGSYFRSLPIFVKVDDTPVIYKCAMKLILRVKCYVNCTFKGRAYEYN
ncbi:putative capsid protein [Spinybacked orbweaver circular virus 1]|uniref:Putative capsid protein n=1 Tax=Spinybacked orbweaver circular virus 1 TaxID=2293305 RepID=A0A346BPA1_9VIRU|nr:putative capsid protein [Spinybacked orbweaver circular virus 1]AXL65898.1 putative capsid protein [Spinybacked orbweaver circular virus 1]